MVLFQAEVKSGNLINERTVSAQISSSDLKRTNKQVSHAVHYLTPELNVENQHDVYNFTKRKCTRLTFFKCLCKGFYFSLTIFKY